MYIASSSVTISESEFQNLTELIIVEEQFMHHHQQSELKDHSSATTDKNTGMLEVEEGQYMLHPPTSLLMGQCLLTTMHIAVTVVVEP